MSDRIVEWLDSLELPPCSCGGDEDALCPACARMIAVGRLRARAPTWGEVREAIAQALEAEAARLGKRHRLIAAIDPHGETAATLSAREHELTLAADIARKWYPGVPRA